MKFNKQIILNLFNLRREKNGIIKEELKLSSELKSYLESNSLNSLSYKNINVNIGTRERTEFNKELFTKEHPTIDINKYFVKKPFEVLNFTEM